MSMRSSLSIYSLTLKNPSRLMRQNLLLQKPCCCFNSLCSFSFSSYAQGFHFLKQAFLSLIASLTLHVNHAVILLALVIPLLSQKQKVDVRAHKIYLNIHMRAIHFLMPTMSNQIMHKLLSSLECFIRFGRDCQCCAFQT